MSGFCAFDSSFWVTTETISHYSHSGGWVLILLEALEPKNDACQGIKMPTAFTSGKCVTTLFLSVLRARLESTLPLPLVSSIGS